MAEVRNVLRNGAEVKNLTDGKVADRDVPGVQKAVSGTTSGTGKPVGQPDEAQRPQAEVRSGDGVRNEAVKGKEASQLEAAQRLSSLGGASATERLLGLDLKPTMLGALVAPPGNNDFLRHLTPTMRRTIMRNMLARQRKRMKRLARFLREEREQHNQGENSDEESFLEAVASPMELSESDLNRAIGELGKSARMLDVLDELLVMQDYTISQIGTFSQG
ncbi:MAG: hypothetical protein HKN33_04600 [Pyrinomonadaceae bacterium]|nr:hypothetical protein [Pyrinomonadaceae bacterium]